MYKDFCEILPTLKRKNFKMAILTNGTIKSQRNKIQLLNLNEYFDLVCIARELGEDYEKPNCAGYRYIIESLNVESKNTIYIGDNPYYDFQGAKELGISTVRLRRGEFKDIEINNHYVDYEIFHYTELLKIIS